MKTFHYYIPRPNEVVWVSTSEIKHLYNGDIKNHPKYKELKTVKAKSIREAMTMDLEESETKKVRNPNRMEEVCNATYVNPNMKRD